MMSSASAVPTSSLAGEVAAQRREGGSHCRRVLTNTPLSIPPPQGGREQTAFGVA